MPRTSEPDWFPFYPDIFVSDGDVEAMSTKELGCYILLLCKSWRERPPGSIPDDDRVLARWSRVTPDEWTECRTGVLRAFKLGADSRWHQHRVRLEYDKARVLILSRSKAGRLGAKSKWQSHSMANGNAMAKPMAMTYTSDVNVVVPVSSSSEERVQREKPPPCPIPSVNDLVSDELLSLASEWKGRVLGPHELCEVANRVQDHGEPLVTKAMKMHLRGGKALGNWVYLDKIIEGGCRERGPVAHGSSDVAAIIAEMESELGG